MVVRGPVYIRYSIMSYVTPKFKAISSRDTVITHSRFGEDRLRGSGLVAGSKVQHFPLTLLVVLTTLSHCHVSESSRIVLKTVVDLLNGGMSACCTASPVVR